MALSLLRARLSVGRSCATGIVRAIGVGKDVSKAGKAISYDANFGNNVRRFSADAGNSSSTKHVIGGFTAWQILAGCLSTTGWSYVLVSLAVAEKDLDRKLANLEDKTKVDLRRHVDSKFSEADQGPTQSKASADALGTRKSIDDAMSSLEQTRRSIQTEANLALLQIHSSHGELNRDIAGINSKLLSCQERLGSVLSRMNSVAATNEGIYAECTREITKLRQEVRDIDRKVISRAANEKVSTDCTQEIAKLRREVRDIDWKQLNSRAANEGISAECTREIAKLKQEVRDIDRKVSEGKKNSAECSCSQDIV